jgi:uncharacterized protein YbbC (DUF1343 family)
MFSFRTTKLEEQPDLVLRSGRIGVLCNHVAWNPEKGEYLFETLYKKGNLKRVFTPEHGLFGEHQDQVKVDSASIYERMGMKGCEFVSLYGTSEESLYAQKDKLTDIDALIIELQDVGSRYYTFLSTVNNLFKVLHKNNINISVYVLDRENPIGRSVEGSMLRDEYSSFIGISGLPNRHGLTIGEMANSFHTEIGAKFPLHIISYITRSATKFMMPWSIPPSPNIAGLFTSGFYTGQCLWEGTNVSEGRGTTRPFELFGAPYMKELADYNIKHKCSNWNDPNNPLSDQGAFIRWNIFIPTFSKYCGENCFGFQLLLNPGVNYHSYLHALRSIRFVKDNCPNDFEFKKGKYEAGNDKSAIELLVGDKLILDYLYQNGPEWDDVREHVKVEEQKWIRKAKKYLLYDDPLWRVK